MHPNLSFHKEVLNLISPYVHRTPVLTSSSLNDEVGAEFFFKAEHLQRMGAFKMRGATHAAMRLSDSSRKLGLVTHSSGNHGQAVALAAKSLGIPAHVVVPRNAPKSKLEAMIGYGAQISFCEPTQEAREKMAAEIVAETGGHFIHPSNNENVIWGQGTAALELLEDVPNLDIIIVAVGGGGLLAGTCLAAKAINPNIEVIAAEPELVSDAYESLQAGEIIPSSGAATIADGLRTSLGSINFPVIKKYTSEILLVNEDEIAAATKWTWSRMKQIIEPSAGVPLAAVRRYPEKFRGKRVGIILCGGNTDLDALPF
ncbi:pyridoxal-phosphate dependent enzyme [Phaeocystidibacter luteus]|uniref:Pyridoxal-phosphate dependent enzyme n=1 Tax=Phaeocystidibacter luteus TaxID=911197 RepID=A0A6N6RIR2_9FLAO|nr:pyridoxal-phosphate dependent enzyme [Phaeocystidibacter luteus]KAB2813866.1 pyridoxal-phosphate dependent enzyme [Phaeocystidibacter luteus]